MSLKKLFQSAVALLREQDVEFAVGGGFAAALYRKEPRLTMDVDLVIQTGSSGKETAITVIEALGLKAGIARKADLAGGPHFAIRKRNTPPCIIIGRPEGEPDGEGVDILLPAIPWVRYAVDRAQANLVDFGFGSVPVLSLEDVVVSKLYALSGAKLRAKDLDDLQSIFETEPDIDLAYISGQMQRLEIIIPKEAKPLLPEPLLKLSREIGRSRR